jgi:hypothetical protein
MLFKIKTAEWLDDEGEIGIFYCHEMLKCGGCSSVILRRTSHFSEDDPGVNTVELFPPATSRRPPLWLDDLKGEQKTRVIHDLLEEVYVGVQNGIKQLAVMGIRSVLELVMVKSVGDQGTFGKNLRLFAEHKGISAEQVKMLETVLEAGHAVTHREYCPTDDDLHTCINFAESIVHSTYILPRQAVALKKRVPKRKRLRRSKKQHPQ